MEKFWPSSANTFPHFSRFRQKTEKKIEEASLIGRKTTRDLNKSVALATLQKKNFEVWFWKSF